MFRAPRLPTPEKIIISKPGEDGDKEDEIITIEEPRQVIIKSFEILNLAKS